ncbi:MAG TPA: hypothetical protein VEI96_02445 [Thermodesulfovibrionales bacterium]|nr:hypothetical protein [Thermodesulfovibrionales bacterium]
MTRMNGIAGCGMIVVALLFSLLVRVQAESHENHGPTGKSLFTKHFQDTLFDITGHGAYSVEILLDDKEYKIGKNVIGIVVHDAQDSDVAGAELIISYKHLATNENLTDALHVTDKGNGLYIVSGLDLGREGRRELSVTVKKGNVEDGAKFIFPDALKERLPKGRYSP